MSPIFTCAGNSILLSSSHFLSSFILSLCPLFLSFHGFFPCPLTFYSHLLSVSVSLHLPPSVLYCPSVLFFYCWELMSEPSAVIQLSHSLLSPIHSTPLCPSARHRPATLLLRTTSLRLTILSGLLRSDWYTTRGSPVLVQNFLFFFFFLSCSFFSSTLPFFLLHFLNARLPECTLFNLSRQLHDL